jgi:hypothetical protein
MAKSNTTTEFPKMGDSIPKSVCNLSGQSSRYTTLVKKGGSSGGSAPSKTANHRSSVMIHEANGPKFTPVATLYKANAADAGKQLRNVKMMKSTISRGDFWSARAATGQK